MSEKFFSSNIENNDVTPNTEDADYRKLITKLKVISTNIDLLKKNYLDKFKIFDKK